MTRQPSRIGVLGAGSLGLTVAYRLAQQGFSVTVIERERQPGGLAAGFPVGNTHLEKFYHHLFRTDREIIALIQELGLGKELLWLRPKTSVLLGGRTYQLDSATSVLRFSPLGLPDRLRLGAAIAYLKARPNHHGLERVTAHSWIRRWMGRSTYEKVWQPLLQSKFGARYPDITMSWFWARVHDRTPSLGYLRGSFQRLYDCLAAEVQQRGGTVRLEEAVSEIAPTPDGSITITTPRGEEHYDVVVATLPSRVVVRLTRGLPDDFRCRYDWGEAYGAHCLILSLDHQLMPETYWLNVNDPGYPFLAAVEHTNMMPPSEYGGRRLVYLGNYLPMDHPLFAKSEEEILAEFLPHLKRINPSFDPGWVKEYWDFKAPYAQPIVTAEYADHIPPHRTPIPNLYLANMFQVYPHDRGQNYSVALANEVAGMVLADHSPGH